jgi:hypothetical protein
VQLGLLRIKSATTAVLLSTIIFLGGGIIGTFHHLYFTGIPEGANVTIMNAFGLQIGEQPVVNEDSIHDDIEKSNSDIAVKDVIVPENILNSLNSSSEDIDKVKVMLIETINSPIIESMIMENVINQDNNEYKSIDEFKESFKESLRDIGVEKKKLTMQEIIEQENKFYEKINK